MPKISGIKNSLTVLHLPFDVGIADCKVDVEPSFILKASDECTWLIPKEIEDAGEVDSWLAMCIGGGVAGISAFNAAKFLEGEIISIEGNSCARLSTMPNIRQYNSNCR